MSEARDRRTHGLRGRGTQWREHGWHSDFTDYDAARVAVLGRRIVEVSDELVEFAGSAPPSSDVGGMLRSIADRLRWEWVPVVAAPAHRHDADVVGGARRAGGGRPCRPPTAHGDADEVARWWNDLNVFQRAAVLAVTPSAIGNLDGVPAWARDQANRQLLASDLERLDDRRPRTTR